jgi:low temperature requirement protein LtrA
MAPRDPHEPHRVASTLELFFDLTFVVGVSVAATELVHAYETGFAVGVFRFVLVFFAVWWAWMNFTWFASAFDTDDWLYRTLTILQMAGVLVVSAGIPAVMEQGDLVVVVIGYVLMRLALVAQWLRAARHPTYRGTALRYATGVGIVQLAWVLVLLLELVPPHEVPPVALLVLIAAELVVPTWAERSGVTPFHRHHIAERYGLFTLIVLGEGLLSITNALIAAQHGTARTVDLVLLGITALVIIAGMWWTYFARTPPLLDAGFGGTFAFGYVHYLVFGSAAALASGVELAIAVDSDPRAAVPAFTGPLGLAGVLAATTVPLAVFVLSTWFVVLRRSLGPAALVAVPVLGVLMGLAAFVPAGLQVAALLVLVLIVVLEVDARARPALAA